jgi:hypothetical protein
MVNKEKNHPHFAKLAEAFSPEAVKHLFNLSIGDSGRDLRLIQQLAYLAVVVFTGMRAIDIYNCRSANISAVDATRIPGKVLSRYYKFQLDAFKNDPDGTGTILVDYYWSISYMFFVDHSCLS